MNPFIVKYRETGEQFIVLNQNGPWWTVASTKTKEMRGVKSLKGYDFVGFPKNTTS